MGDRQLTLWRDTRNQLALTGVGIAATPAWNYGKYLVGKIIDRGLVRAGEHIATQASNGVTRLGEGVLKRIRDTKLEAIKAPPHKRRKLLQRARKDIKRLINAPVVYSGHGGRVVYCKQRTKRYRRRRRR